MDIEASATRLIHRALVNLGTVAQRIATKVFCVQAVLELSYNL